MAEQHTPGPWKIGRFESYEGDTGVSFRRVYFPAAKGQISEAHVRGENCDQNAHLIAAAPDLLAALEVANKLLGDIPAAKNNPKVAASIHASRAALSKARGQS